MKTGGDSRFSDGFEATDAAERLYQNSDDGKGSGSQSGAQEEEDLGIDMHEFLFPLVLVSQGELAEKVEFLFSRFDCANIGWINSVAVFILFATCIKGLNRLLTMHTPSLRMVQDFLRTYAPADDRWTVKVLCDALKTDSYASKCVEAIQVTHSAENAKGQATKLWQAIQKRVKKRVERAQQNQAMIDRQNAAGSGGVAGKSVLGGKATVGPAGSSTVSNWLNPSASGVLSPLGSANLGMMKPSGATMSITKNLGGEENAASKYVGGEVSTDISFHDVEAIIRECLPVLDSELVAEILQAGRKFCSVSDLVFAKSHRDESKENFNPFYPPLSEEDLFIILAPAVAFSCLDQNSSGILSVKDVSYVLKLAQVLNTEYDGITYWDDLIGLTRYQEDFTREVRGDPPVEVVRMTDFVFQCALTGFVENRKRYNEHLMKVFLKYDKDNSGSIDLEEFMLTVRDFLCEMIIPMNDSQIMLIESIARNISEELIAAMDDDNSG